MHNIIVSEFSTEYKLKAVRNESFDLNKIVNNHNQSELILRSLYDGSIMIYESFFVLFLVGVNYITRLTSSKVVSPRRAAITPCCNSVSMPSSLA